MTIRTLLLAALAAALFGSGGCLGPMTPSRASRYLETTAPVLTVSGSSNVTLTVTLTKGDGQLVDTSGGGDAITPTQDVRPTTTVTVPAQAARQGLASLIDGVLALFGKTAAAGSAPAGSAAPDPGCDGGQCSEPACPGGQCAEPN